MVSGIRRPLADGTLSSFAPRPCLMAAGSAALVLSLVLAAGCANGERLRRWGLEGVDLLDASQAMPRLTCALAHPEYRQWAQQKIDAMGNAAAQWIVSQAETCPPGFASKGGSCPFNCSVLWECLVRIGPQSASIIADLVRLLRRPLARKGALATLARIAPSAVPRGETKLPCDACIEACDVEACPSLLEMVANPEVRWCANNRPSRFIPSSVARFKPGETKSEYRLRMEGIRSSYPVREARWQRECSGMLRAGLAEHYLCVERARSCLWSCDFAFPNCEPAE